MQRTPPKSTLTQEKSVSQPDLTSSAANTDLTSDGSHITVRNGKRVRLDDSPEAVELDTTFHRDFDAFKTELLEMFSDWKTEQEQPLTEESLRSIVRQELGTSIKNTIKELVTDQLSSINEHLGVFQNSLQFFNEKFEEFKNRLDAKDSIIATIKADNERLKSNVNELTTRLGVVEQHLRESNIEINGIPEHKNENLANTIINLTSIIGSPLIDNDILKVTRIAKLNKDSDRPRSVIAKLQSPRQRDAILAAVASYNKKHPKDKLSSHHLGIAGNRAPVFVTEHLSPANKQLHSATRKVAKENSYKFVWIRNGRIFVRKDVDCDSIYIRNAETLNRLKNSPQSNRE